jgi:heme A synthase
MTPTYQLSLVFVVIAIGICALRASVPLPPQAIDGLLAALLFLCGLIVGGLIATDDEADRSRDRRAKGEGEENEW